MKSTDLRITQITFDGGLRTTEGVELYHFYPSTLEVYDAIGNHIGTGTWEGKQLIVKPIDYPPKSTS